MDILTGEEVRLKVAGLGIMSYAFRECGACRAPIEFIFRDGGAFYDGRCECDPMRKLEPRSWNQIAEYFNQLMPEDREQAWWHFLLHSVKIIDGLVSETLDVGVLLHDLLPSSNLCLCYKGERLVTIKPDGSIIRGEAFTTIEEASVLFWDAVAEAFPSWKDGALHF